MDPLSVIGMVHLGALPGAPDYDGDLQAVIDAAVIDATTLAAAGFDGVMVENFGDAPFFAILLELGNDLGNFRQTAFFGERV